MSTKHIKASNKGLRHFSRHTDRCRMADEGGCDYENRFVGDVVAKEPPSFPKTGYPRHHILPVGAVGLFETFDAYDTRQRVAIRGVYRKTRWCASREQNIIVLPIKGTYARTHRDEVRRLDLPCHDVDHGCAQGYTDEVTTRVEARIWKKFKKASDKGHPQPEQVLEDLKELEREFRIELERRGERSGGTAVARHALATKDRKSIQKDESWLPFSMADDRVAGMRMLLSLGERPQWFKDKLASRYPRPKKKANR